MPAEEREHLREEMQGARNQGLFTPPGTQNTVEMPGNNGGANFGGVASDPARGLSIRRVQGSSRHAQAGIGRGGGGLGNEFSRTAWPRSLCYKLPAVSRRGPERTTARCSIVGRYRIADSLQKDIRAIVTQGDGPMPAFAKLSDADLDSLLAYLFNPARAPAPAGPENSYRREGLRECPVQKRLWLHVYQ